jgi:hypothetical protein
MSNELFLMPSVVLNPLEGAVTDFSGMPAERWPQKPSGIMTARDEQGVSNMEAATALPEIEIFEHINFGGRSWRTNLNYLYVGGWWNDRISSIIIVRGRWRFYQHRDYRGAYWDLSGPAYYPWVEDANIPNDIISSFRFLGW